MPSSDYEDNQLGLQLLQIKSKLCKNMYTEEDVEVFRLSLARGDDLALIAAGYTLSENFTPLKPLAVEVLQKRLIEILATKILPRAWAQTAILEGLSLTDNVILLSKKGDLLIYIKMLLSSHDKPAGFMNLRFLLHRLADLNVSEATAIIKGLEIEE
jgi:hypothetical protein